MRPRVASLESRNAMAAQSSEQWRTLPVPDSEADWSLDFVDLVKHCLSDAKFTSFPAQTHPYFAQRRRIPTPHNEAQSVLRSGISNKLPRKRPLRKRPRRKRPHTIPSPPPHALQQVLQDQADARQGAEQEQGAPPPRSSVAALVAPVPPARTPPTSRASFR